MYYLIPYFEAHNKKILCTFSEDIWQLLDVICPLLHSMHVLLPYIFNPLKPELNPICYLLALLGAHHFLHVSRIRVKSLTLR